MDYSRNLPHSIIHTKYTVNFRMAAKAYKNKNHYVNLDCTATSSKFYCMVASVYSIQALSIAH